MDQYILYTQTQNYMDRDRKRIPRRPLSIGEFVFQNVGSFIRSPRTLKNNSLVSIIRSGSFKEHEMVDACSNYDINQIIGSYSPLVAACESRYTILANHLIGLGADVLCEELTPIGNNPILLAMRGNLENLGVSMVGKINQEQLSITLRKIIFTQAAIYNSVWMINSLIQHGIYPKNYSLYADSHYSLADYLIDNSEEVLLRMIYNNKIKVDSKTLRKAINKKNVLSALLLHTEYTNDDIYDILKFNIPEDAKSLIFSILKNIPPENKEREKFFLHLNSEVQNIYVDSDTDNTNESNSETEIVEIKPESPKKVDEVRPIIKVVEPPSDESEDNNFEEFIIVDETHY